jgi:hypothetical protein
MRRATAMKFDAIDIIEFFPDNELPLDISNEPFEIGGLDYGALGFGPDGGPWGGEAA